MKRPYVLTSHPKSRFPHMTVVRSEIILDVIIFERNLARLTELHISQIPEKYIGRTGILHVEFDTGKFTKPFLIAKTTYDEICVPESYIINHSKHIKVYVSIDGDDERLNLHDTRVWLSLMIEEYKPIKPTN